MIVTVELKGGLGNQLFQIFTTLAYAYQNGLQPVFLYSKTLNIGVKRQTYWNNFLQGLLQYTTKEKVKTDFQYREPHFHYSPITVPVDKNNIFLNGYFQSYLYFEDQLERILTEIEFNKIQKMILEAYQSTYFDQPVIAMHFRLGDYVKKQSFHPVLPTVYYANALREIIQTSQKVEKVERVLYFFQREDRVEVEKRITILKEEFPELDFLPVDTAITDWQQMILISLCQHQVIANSTFSWWGAYLSHLGSERGMVCYPEMWFGPRLKSSNTSTLFPKTWKKIPCRNIVTLKVTHGVPSTCHPSNL